MDRTTWLLLFGLAAIIAVAFGGLARAQFILLDDDLYVMRNPHVLSGLTTENIGWALRSPHYGYWMPLTWLSLQLDATLSAWFFGGPPPLLQDGVPMPSAVVYHLDNLALHVLGSGFLFLSLYRLSRQRLPSFIAALLWAIHPLRVESVAWVTERKDVLGGLLGFMALYAYAWWCDRPGRRRYALLCAAFAGSLLAKPTLFIVFPAMLLLLDYWPLGRLSSWKEFHKRFDEKWALLLLSAASLLILPFSQKTASAALNLDQEGLWPRVAVATTSYVRYLTMHAAVGRLAVFYPLVQPEEVLPVIAAATFLLAITAACFWQRRQRPWLLIGWLWYLGTSLPVIGLVQVGLQGYADRFTYLPSVGLLIMVIWSVPWQKVRSRLIANAVATVICVILVGFTMQQVGYWKDSFALFERTLEVTEVEGKENYLIQDRLRAAHQQRGDAMENSPATIKAGTGEEH